MPVPKENQNVFARASAAVLVLVLPGLAARAQSEPEALDLESGQEITLELVMSDPDWLGRAPEEPYWGDLGDRFYFSRRRASEPIRDLFRATLEGDEAPVLIEPAEAAQESVSSGQWHYDEAAGRFDQKLYIREGDVYHVDLETGERRQLTRTTITESQPVFMTDGNIGFRRGDSFLVRDLSTGLESEPFPFRFEKDPQEEELESDKKKNYLERQQEALFDIVRERERRRDILEEQNRRAALEDPSLPGTPFYVGDDVELGSGVSSPSGRRLALLLLPKDRTRTPPTEMPEWVTASGHIETREVRSKVGADEPFQARLVVLDRVTRKITPVDLSSLPGIEDDPLEELREAAAEREKARREELEVAAGRNEGEAENSDAGAEDEEGEESNRDERSARPVEIRALSFNHDGTHLVYQAFSFDNKDRWLASVDLESGKSRVLHHLHDPAWINWSFNDYGWARDGKSVWLLSEESGYSHLYTVELASVGDNDDDLPTARAVTQGDFVVSEPELSPDGRHFFFRANREHPGQFEIYRTPTDGSWIERLTDLGGMASARLSPSGDHLLITHSTTTRPDEIYVQPATRGEPATRRTFTVSEAFERRSWVAPNHVEVPSSVVKRPIHSRLYLPREEQQGERPAVLFVHGAGYLQNAHKGWSGYFREFMFHSFLVERGFVVLDMDYRASAGYGRDWRTAIYRRMGTPELEDLRDGVDWLVKNHGVDRSRIGVYGGSYGGFLTLMALFNEPDLFAAGAALRPVTDWAHYNHSYTSNILNTPEVDPEAYARSSPIEFAAGLEEPLLICAPMLDDNVFFQDSVRLVQRLIELEKQDWWIALYPIEPHGFREPSSWLDEYRRIWQLFESYVGLAESR